MSSTSEWVIYRGTKEFRVLTIGANVDLVAQPIRISFDRTTWLDCEWIGEVGKVRKAEILLDDTDPETSPLPARDAASVFVRLTDTTEVPLFKAGQARFV